MLLLIVALSAALGFAAAHLCALATASRPLWLRIVLDLLVTTGPAVALLALHSYLTMIVTPVWLAAALLTNIARWVRPPYRGRYARQNG